MCLTTQALALFISLLPADRIEHHENRIIIHAEVGPAHWIPDDGVYWCTDAKDRHSETMLAPQVG